MEAWFRSSGLWRIVNGLTALPTLSEKPTDAQLLAVETWETKSDKAAGWLFLMVEDDQKVHFNEIRGDPVAMWTALQAVHMQKRPGHRFNAYDDLFSIRKQEDESLQTLMNKDLRPSGFDLKQLDDELASMAMIRALPDEYSAFTSSLLLLDKLDKATIHQAFKLAKENNAKKRRGGNKANKANVVEFAGNASALSSTFDPSNPSNPLQTDADFDWNADTGATSFMTPHCHWIRNYVQTSIPIKLADNTIVYAVGVGSVHFRPIVNGKEVRSVEWTRVLHVPQLRSNLLHKAKARSYM
ncbi:hypothetical protein BYT27DRAFT_7219966 [Phlegmacium glaucopus]|nr:hypothetical protein BYT27DRAFT_7219966 [Phlegmacium glaucopus]